jgi:pyruvate kinase
MLDSMREQLVPTRAEVNDVANAILDGTDAVMLSDETAVGSYPIPAVEVMAEIALAVEGEYSHNTGLNRTHFTKGDAVANAVTHAIARESAFLEAQAIVALTESGRTARLVARHRPNQKLYMLTSHDHTYKLGLIIHGCTPIRIDPITSLDDAVAKIRQVFLSHKVAKKNDLFIIGLGRPYGQSGATNAMVIERL